MHVRELFELRGKVAIVTGGSRGLGLEIAEGLAEAGAQVAITGRRKAWLDEAVARLRACGAEPLALELDVVEPEAPRRTVDATAARFGGVDLLINNAGITWGAPSLEYPEDRWRQVLEVDLTAAWRMSQAAAPRMIERGGGRIVMLSSVAGLVGSPPEIQDTVAYSAAKAGLNGLTRDLAVKWARHGINVNAVAPGYFPTRLTSALIQRNEAAMRALSPLDRRGARASSRAWSCSWRSPAASHGDRPGARGRRGNDRGARPVPPAPPRPRRRRPAPRRSRRTPRPTPRRAGARDLLGRAQAPQRDVSAVAGGAAGQGLQVREHLRRGDRAGADRVGADPERPYSSATLRVSASTPAFAAPYGPRPNTAPRAAPEDVVRIEPERCGTITRSAAFMPDQTASRSSARSRRKRACRSAPSAWGMAPPALPWKTSSRSNTRTAVGDQPVEHAALGHVARTGARLATRRLDLGHQRRERGLVAVVGRARAHPPRRSAARWRARSRRRPP